MVYVFQGVDDSALIGTRLLEEESPVVPVIGIGVSKLIFNG